MVRRKTTLILIVSATLLIALLLKFDFNLFFEGGEANGGNDGSSSSAFFAVDNSWKPVIKSARSIGAVSRDDEVLAARNKAMPTNTIAGANNTISNSIVTFSLHIDLESSGNNTNNKYRTCSGFRQAQPISDADEMFDLAINASLPLHTFVLPETSASRTSAELNEDRILSDYADGLPESSALFTEWSPEFAVDPFEPKNDRVLNPYPFRFLIEEPDACCRALEQYKPKDNRLKAVILVHTHPEAVENRQLIRDTWATPRWQSRFVMLTLFVMGRSENDTVQEALWRESETHHDIVQSSFLASYRNNTYNTMAALKWATRNCHEQTHFIVKTDDDFVINIFRFNIYLTGILNKRGLENSRHDMFVRCASLFRKARPIRDKTSKWYVSKELWPHNSYPSICLGGAVMFTPASAERLYDEAHYYEFFPLDDVFVTGIIAQNISDFKLIHMPGPNGWVMCQSEPKCLIKNRVMFYHTMQTHSVMRKFWSFLESQYERKLQLLGFQ